MLDQPRVGEARKVLMRTRYLVVLVLALLLAGCGGGGVSTCLDPVVKHPLESKEVSNALQ